MKRKTEIEIKKTIESWTATDNISKFNKKDGCIDVYTPHALIQIAGYIKHIMKENIIIFRGQTKDYDNLKPALYRNNKSDKTFSYKISQKTKELLVIIDAIKKYDFFVNGTDEEYFEAILQHYGFKTRYIDFVDNIWVALVFSSLSWRENVISNIDELSYFDDDGYGYIYILCAGKMLEENNCIVNTNKEYEIIDLRKCVPSIYLRPHAQHGILIKKIPQRGRLTTAKVDMHSDIIAKIRISKSTTIRWINNSKLLTPEFLFPSTYFDGGYSQLSSIDIKNIYNELITMKKIPYRSVKDVFSMFGAIKRYTYDGTSSDYNHHNNPI